MTRPHPLVIALTTLLSAIFLWLQYVPNKGYLLYWQHGITKSHVHHGWPFEFLFLLNNDTHIQLPALLLNAATAFTLIAVPMRVCHRLLNRTLHIQLRTAVLLMLTSATLLFLNIHEQVDASWIPHTIFYGWPARCAYKGEDGHVMIPPGIAINSFIALAILSTVLLLSELLLTRHKPTEGD